jgi:hypothetical protein
MTYNAFSKELQYGNKKNAEYDTDFEISEKLFLQKGFP